MAVGRIVGRGDLLDPLGRGLPVLDLVLVGYILGVCWLRSLLACFLSTSRSDRCSVAVTGGMSVFHVIFTIFNIFSTSFQFPISILDQNWFKLEISLLSLVSMQSYCWWNGKNTVLQLQCKWFHTKMYSLGLRILSFISISLVNWMVVFFLTQTFCLTFVFLW